MDNLIVHKVIHKTDRASWKAKKFYSFLSPGEKLTRFITKQELNTKIRTFSPEQIANAKAAFKLTKRPRPYVQALCGRLYTEYGGKAPLIATRADAAEYIGRYSEEEVGIVKRQMRANGWR